jgi:hypothetical protein
VLRQPDGTHEERAREFGFSDYRKTGEVDLGPAYEYWGAAKPYTAAIRQGREPTCP